MKRVTWIVRAWRRLPTMKVGWHWNQWLVGGMVDYGRIVPVRWVVLFAGPLSLSISAGRRANMLAILTHLYANTTRHE